MDETERRRLSEEIARALGWEQSGTNSWFHSQGDVTGAVYYYPKAFDFDSPEIIKAILESVDPCSELTLIKLHDHWSCTLHDSDTEDLFDGRGATQFEALARAFVASKETTEDEDEGDDALRAENDGYDG